MVMLLCRVEFDVSSSAKLRTRRCQLARNARAQNVSVQISQPRLRLNFLRTASCSVLHPAILLFVHSLPGESWMRCRVCFNLLGISR